MKEELINKAENHDLNVEDIIKVSSSRDPDISIILQEIKERMSWPTNLVENVDGSIIPPMGMWIDVASEYIVNGYDGLFELAKDENKVRFVIGFLQEFKTTESVNVLLRISDIYSVSSNCQKNTLIKIISGLNRILSFPGAPVIEDSTRSKARELIQESLKLCNSQSEYGNLLCALRGVGDEESIKLISIVPKLVGEWSGTESIVKKAIKNRLKKV